jgi:hypothetical protein
VLEELFGDHDTRVVEEDVYVSHLQQTKCRSHLRLSEGVFKVISGFLQEQEQKGSKTTSKQHQNNKTVPILKPKRP